MLSRHTLSGPIKTKVVIDKKIKLRIYFAIAKLKLFITSYNTAYLVTAFIHKPPPIFASATLRQTSDMPKR